jgi:S-layer homology domain
MKKILIMAVVLATLGVNTALADVLPPGQKTVPVCAYFNNIHDFVGEMVVFGYEESPVSDSTLTEYVEGECFTQDYKFNTISLFAVTLEYSPVIDGDGYNPTLDPGAYPANMSAETGILYVGENDTLTEVRNVYRIVELNGVEEQLMIEPVQTERFYSDKDNPIIIDGVATLMTGENLDTFPDTTEDLFTDIDTDSPYYDALVYLKENGSVDGYPDGSFKPEITINRAEFVKMTVGSVASAQELEDCVEYYVEDGKDVVMLFNDVIYNVAQGGLPEWYFPYICEAKRRSVVGGYPDGHFLPSSKINFVEAAKIIVETVSISTEESDPWYKRYVEALATKKAIPVTLTRFDQRITRGEMAEILYRLRAGIMQLPSTPYNDLR